MKQVLRKGFGQIVVDDVPDPVAVPHHVLVRPHFSLISSGTETASIHPDVLKVLAHNPSHLQKVVEVAAAQGPLATLRELKARFSAYAVLGYSGAGVVVDKHPSVTDLQIGDRVAYGGEGTGHAETILTGRNLVAPVPEALALDQACFATLGAIALNAVRVANVGVGDVVAVIGLGLVGQLIAQLVRVQGGVTVGIDLRSERVTLAAQLGAEHVISGDPAAVKDAVLGNTNGRGADCVIIAAAAKSAAPCEQALAILRDRGRIVVVGAVELQFPWLEMYLKEIKVFMSRAYGPGSYDPAYEGKAQDYPISYVRWTENRNMQEFLRLLATSRVQVEPLISDRYSLEEAPQAYEKIMAPGSGTLAVILRYPHPDKPAEKLERRVTGPGAGSEKAALNFALAGGAGIARWAHLPVLEKMADVRLRAIYSTSGARGKTFANRYKAVYCTSSYDEILRDPDVDAVLIVSRNQHHARETVAALRAGKHVFVEKPMALTVAECRQIVQAYIESGRKLTVGFNRRFAPLYVDLKKQIARRASPVVINCRVNSPGISGPFWMADPSIGGAILGEAVHFVDLLYWLLESEPLSVSAYSLPTGRQEPVGENNIAATFRFEDGSIATLTYCTVGSRTSAGERVEVFATGVGALSEDFRRFAVKTGIVRRRSHLFARKGYDQQMKAFIDSIRSGAAESVTVRDGVRATLGCIAIMESARTGDPVNIALDEVMAT
jgi:predicted dehydrogenase/threonine dehydrogenase-like Zn-dependent dehydrogenase